MAVVLACGGKESSGTAEGSGSGSDTSQTEAGSDTDGTGNGSGSDTGSDTGESGTGTGGTGSGSDTSATTGSISSGTGSVTSGTGSGQTGTTTDTQTTGTGSGSGSTSTSGAICDETGTSTGTESFGPDVEDCELGVDRWRVCITEALEDGHERCEILGGYGPAWGPCMADCDPQDSGTSRTCDLDNGVGVEFCAAWSPDTVHRWGPCLVPECVVCQPGDSRECGEGTPYPDTIIYCVVDYAHGVPYWADGDCYT